MTIETAADRLPADLPIPAKGRFASFGECETEAIENRSFVEPQWHRTRHPSRGLLFVAVHRGRWIEVVPGD